MAKNNKKTTQIIVGHHRSAALAERHRRQLEHDTGSAVEIIARRRADGRYSTRGHVFEFEITEPENVDWIIIIEYKGRDGRTFVRDFIVPGPSNASLNDLKEIALETMPERLHGLIRQWRSDRVTISRGPKTRRKKAELR